MSSKSTTDQKTSESFVEWKKAPFKDARITEQKQVKCSTRTDTTFKQSYLTSISSSGP